MSPKTREVLVIWILLPLLVAAFGCMLLFVEDPDVLKLAIAYVVIAFGCFLFLALVFRLHVLLTATISGMAVSSSAACGAMTANVDATAALFALDPMVVRDGILLFGMIATCTVFGSIQVALTTTRFRSSPFVILLERLLATATVGFMAHLGFSLTGGVALLVAVLSPLALYWYEHHLEKMAESSGLVTDA